MPALIVVAGSLICLGLAGCGSEPESLPSDAPLPELFELEPAEAPDCWPDGTQAYQGGTADMTGTVVVLGEGEQGIVLGPQASEDFCGWAEQAQRLAEAGYLVASFSWTSDGRVSFMAAVAALQEAGASDVVLMGASKGGCYAAAMADDLDVTPVGVVALSPPSEYGVDARSANSSYVGPLLVIASTDDGSVDVEDSRLVARADDPDTFVELDGDAHGWALFDGDHAAEVEQMIDDFLAAAFGG
jgi:dienelactone hydrolase